MTEAAKASRALTGRVKSSKMDKTITVVVDRVVRHPMYGKYMRLSTRLHAHDENNECKEGDIVMIEQSRPLSKTKSWRLVRVLTRAE
ncbi:30S ribosomal protein S17 [bacterium BMS3Bbin12]|nr:30S ribosomal protein S17 [bacterium BMS3Abin12]GBE48447.1 30S ribosomal protein S17 [bacterium BMS3Bbin12]GBE50198.1 30S ribosomal protein S17 [bacterium BMS3Bbin13]HDJ86300.1 30S ribosomal protein S17 [Chromatiales bacterium]HDK03482.1 30S ribosomal protein S17 [Gammaproteobacteria bacterium]